MLDHQQGLNKGDKEEMIKYMKGFTHAGLSAHAMVCLTNHFFGKMVFVLRLYVVRSLSRPEFLEKFTTLINCTASR